MHVYLLHTIKFDLSIPVCTKPPDSVIFQVYSFFLNFCLHKIMAYNSLHTDYSLLLQCNDCTCYARGDLQLSHGAVCSMPIH